MTHPRKRRWEYDDDQYDGTGRLLPRRAFCSQRCRTKVDSDRVKTRRIEQRHEDAPHLCGGCGEVLDGKRGDAKFCSPACRQKAYRVRKGGAS
jgi:hypothetical protein